MGRIVFITGTDTGVGKTVLTALGVVHLRRRGVNAVGLKPFCSGSRRDVEVLRGANGQSMSLEQLNPYYFNDPVAPILGAWSSNQTIDPALAIARIQAVSTGYDRVLVEGIGGVMVPLAPDFLVADLILGLEAQAIVVARNAVGVLNHTLLTVECLRRRGIALRAVLLMGQRHPDPSASVNERCLNAVLPSPELRVFSLPFLGSDPVAVGNLRTNEKKTEKTLASIWGGS